MIEFSKYQGTGNDFILIDNRADRFQGGVDRIARLCDRHFGIGADGLILLSTASGADFHMTYFNADGRESSMCGNGGRCLVRFAHDLGIAGGEGVFTAIDGRHRYEVHENLVKLQMNDVGPVQRLGHATVLDTGSPHYVAGTHALSSLDLLTEARKVRYSKEFRERGINVNFMERKDGQIFMRTYERGVEAETLSCGTGTVAVALTAALEEPGLESPVQIQAPGGTLLVYFKRLNGGFSDIWLEGPAERVFDGSIP